MKALRRVELTGTAGVIARATITNLSDRIRVCWVDAIQGHKPHNVAVVVESFRSIRLRPIQVRGFRHLYAQSRNLTRIDPEDAGQLEEDLAVWARDGKSVPILYLCSSGVCVFRISRMCLIYGGAA